jgi:hypothetical protein
MTEGELANKLSKSFSWIKDRLGLTKIADEKVAALVDEGKIKLANAFVLAKLDPEEQKNFVDRAITMSPAEFIPLVNKRVSEVRDAKRKGQDAAPAAFAPVAFMQKLTAVKEELDSGKVAKVLVAIAKPKNTEEAFKLGVAWCLHLDPESVKEQKAKDEARRKANDEAAKKREGERAAKKAEQAKSKATEAASVAAALGVK